MITPNKTTKRPAESYSLEVSRITAIEFPGNVVNTSKAIDMLGSQAKVAKACVSRGDKQLELRFRPEDPYEHSIMSSTSKAQNIVLKIQLPKKNLERAHGDIQKALTFSRNDDVKLKPEYIVETTYRFRELSDYQYNTQNSVFLNKVKSTLLSSNYDDIRNFEFDEKERFDISENADIIPPPRFSPLVYPFAYSYRQNPALVAVDDGKGGHQLINRNQGPLLYAQYISWDEKPPQSPSKELQKLTDKGAVECFNFLTNLFEKRPIWTRKAIEHHVPKHLSIYLKQVLHYTSYMIQNGPWRDAVVRFGIDTRSSPEYRFYQTRRFRYNLQRDKDSDKDTRLPYQFDGINMISGTIIQFCDITDSDIKILVDEGRVRKEVDSEAGWYEDIDYHRIKLLLYLKYKAISDNVPLSRSKIKEVSETDIISGTTVRHISQKKSTRSEGSEKEKSDDDDEKGSDLNPSDLEDGVSVVAEQTEDQKDLAPFSVNDQRRLDGLSGFVRQKD